MYRIQNSVRCVSMVVADILDTTEMGIVTNSLKNPKKITIILLLVTSQLKKITIISLLVTCTPKSID